MQYKTLKDVMASNSACIYGMNHRRVNPIEVDRLYPYWVAYHPGVKFIQTKRAILAVKIAKLLGCAEVHSEHRKGSI